MKGLTARGFAALMIFVAGCGQRDAAVEKVPKSADKAVVSNAVTAARAPKSVKSSMLDNPVVVRIDGVDVRKSDILKKAKGMLTLNKNKLRTTKLEKRDWNFLAAYCKGAAQREVARAAVQKFYDDCHLAASTQTVHFVRKSFERSYGVRSKKLKRWHRIEDLKYMLGKNAGVIDQELQDRVAYITVTNAILSKASIEPTEVEVAARIRSIAEHNLRADATNALVFARATNVWRKVVANTNSFEETAKLYSEDEYINIGCEWGTFTSDQLADEDALKQLLPGLKIGDITAPIESDGGLAIIRLDERDSANNMTFSRIFFRLPMYFEVETEEEARLFLRGEKANKVVNDTLKTWVDKLKVEFPDGKNVFGVPAAVTADEFKNCDK